MSKESPTRPYFAHAVNAYDTPLEGSMQRLIADYFGIPFAFNREIGGMGVENPNQPHHQVGYAKYAARAKASDTAHKGMNYFFDEVLPLCDGCVAWPFLDGRMGLGVAGEAKWCIGRGKPVFLVACNLTQQYQPLIPSAAELSAFMNDRYMNPFIIRPLNERERELLLADDPTLVVPHLETRLRTWFRYGEKPMRPFEIAHLARMPLPEDFYPDKS